MAEDLLVRVFVSDGLQFVVRWGREHVVQFPDDRRQVRELVARVELQDGSLGGRREGNLHVGDITGQLLCSFCSNYTLTALDSFLGDDNLGNAKQFIIYYYTS